MTDTEAISILDNVRERSFSHWTRICPEFLTELKDGASRWGWFSYGQGDLPGTQIKTAYDTFMNSLRAMFG